MFGFEFFDQHGRLVFSSSENLFRLVAVLSDRERTGSQVIPGLSGQGEVVAIAYGTGWGGRYSSPGGVAFFMDYVTVSGDVFSWNVPLSADVGSMVPPLTAIDLNRIFIFVR